MNNIKTYLIERLADLIKLKKNQQDTRKLKRIQKQKEDKFQKQQENRF